MFPILGIPLLELLGAVKLGVEVAKEINDATKDVPKEKRKEKKAAVKRKIVASVKDHARNTA